MIESMINSEILCYIFNYIKKITAKSDSEIYYIINLCFDEWKHNYINEEFIINHLFNIYSKNLLIIKKYIKIKNTYKFTDLLKKRNSYVLFEKIELKNINFYLTYWEYLHN